MARDSLGEYKDGEPFLGFLANHEAEIVHFDIDFLQGGLPGGAPVQMDGLFEKKKFHEGGVRWFGLSLNCRQGPPTAVMFRFLPAGPSPSEYILPETPAWIRIRGYFEVTDVWTGMDARAVTPRPIPREAVAVLARPLSEPEGAAIAC